MKQTFWNKQKSWLSINEVILQPRFDYNSRT